MKKLGKKVEMNSEPNEEQRAFLPSSGNPNRCSSLGFNQEPALELLLDHLAELIVAVYHHEKHRNK